MCMQDTVVGDRTNQKSSKSCRRQSHQQQRADFAQSNAGEADEPIQAISRLANRPRDTCPSHNGRQPLTELFTVYLSG